MNKGAQAALWIIIAVAIFAVTIALLLLNRKPISPEVLENNFQSYVDSCIRTAIEEASEKMIIQGGFLNPQNHRTYDGVNVAFICQNMAYYRPCINQHPLYITEIKNEMLSYASPIIESCFSDAVQDLEDKGYVVNSITVNESVELSNNLIRLSLDLSDSLILEKDSQTQNFDDFTIDIKSPIYDLAKVANEISNQEAKYCYFEYLGYSVLYPRFSIRRFVFSDSTEIYSILDKDSNKEMNIAIRGCAIPPGM